MPPKPSSPVFPTGLVMSTRDELLEMLVAAIRQDTEQSLADPKNAFTAASEGDECKCYHNMHVMLRMLISRPHDAKHFMDLIKSHNAGKQCEHVWLYKNSLRALKAYDKPREF